MGTQCGSGRALSSIRARRVRLGETSRRLRLFSARLEGYDDQRWRRVNRRGACDLPAFVSRARARDSRCWRGCRRPSCRRDGCLGCARFGVSGRRVGSISWTFFGRRGRRRGYALWIEVDENVYIVFNRLDAPSRTTVVRSNVRRRFWTRKMRTHRDPRKAAIRETDASRIPSRDGGFDDKHRRETMEAFTYHLFRVACRSWIDVDDAVTGIHPL